MRYRYMLLFFLFYVRNQN